MGRSHKSRINQTRQINKKPIDNDRKVVIRETSFNSATILDKEIEFLSKSSDDLLKCEWMTNYMDMLINQRRSLRKFAVGLRCSEKLDQKEPTTVSELATALEFRDKKKEIIEALTFNDKAITRFRKNKIYIETMERLHERQSLPTFRIKVQFL